MMKKLTAIILAVAMLASFGCASAAPEITESPIAPIASDYLNSYSLCMLAEGNNLMSISFTVCGVGIMDKVGALEIVIEEQIGSYWFEVEVFDGEEEGLFSYGTISNTDTVYFYGYTGRNYRATAYVYAELNGGYDTGTITCAPEVCV